MAIQKIKIRDFKCFKGMFEIELNKGLNILVGSNETGKSTILEAIHIAQSIEKRLSSASEDGRFRQTESVDIEPPIILMLSKSVSVATKILP